MSKAPFPPPGGVKFPVKPGSGIKPLVLPRRASPLQRAQEASLKEQRAALKEREEFLEQSEASLFEKMQAHQERETELEQKAEDVKRAMLKAGLLKAEPQEPMEKA